MTLGSQVFEFGPAIPGLLLNFNLIAAYGIPYRFDAICRLLVEANFLSHARRFRNDGLFVCLRHLNGLVGELGHGLPAGDRMAIHNDLFALQGNLLLHRRFNDVTPDAGRAAAHRPLADTEGFPRPTVWCLRRWSQRARRLVL
jgi:hypothetical protein